MSNHNTFDDLTYEGKVVITKSATKEMDFPNTVLYKVYPNEKRHLTDVDTTSASKGHWTFHSRVQDADLLMASDFEQLQTKILSLQPYPSALVRILIKMLPRQDKKFVVFLMDKQSNIRKCILEELKKPIKNKVFG